MTEIVCHTEGFLVLELWKDSEKLVCRFDRLYLHIIALPFKISASLSLFLLSTKHYKMGSYKAGAVSLSCFVI